MNQTATNAEPTTDTLEVPGAVLTCDVLRNEANTEPVLLIIGSPMGADGFVTLSGHFIDRTVVTYDPRGVGRSTNAHDTAESTPDEHADDLHRLIEALGAAPVDIFASSGGAVNALALVARHPEAVRTLVAHEPPAAQVLPDREAALAASRDIQETYMRSGMGPAMAKFISIVSHRGPIPADFAEQPRPDPAMFGLPTEDDGSRNDSLVGQNIVTCTHYQLDFDALRAASTRIVIGAGASRTASWLIERRSPWQSGSARRRSPSPAGTAASWAVSTARRASPTPSRRPCATFSHVKGEQSGEVRDR